MNVKANQARLFMGAIAYNLLHMLRTFDLLGEEVRRVIEWIIKRLIKVGAKVVYHGRRWQIPGWRAYRPPQEVAAMEFESQAGRCASASDTL